MIVQMCNVNLDLYFYTVQGLIFQPLIVRGYAVIYRKLKIYHIALINKYAKVFNP